MSIKPYTNSNGDIFVLSPYPYNKGDHACVGCAFKFGNSRACREAPTCTPKDDNGNSTVTSRHVYTQISWAN